MFLENQGTRSWNNVLHSVLTKAGFQQTYNDPCLHWKEVSGQFCYVIVYVGDLIIVCVTTGQFEMQILGSIEHYLGI